jgi:hypothetical protein
MNLSNCDTWRVEWGPGSPRPDHFMVYLDDGVGFKEYMGTYLTLSAAIQVAVKSGSEGRDRPRQ